MRDVLSSLTDPEDVSAIKLRANEIVHQVWLQEIKFWDMAYKQ